MNVDSNPTVILTQNYLNLQLFCTFASTLFYINVLTFSNLTFSILSLSCIFGSVLKDKFKKPLV